jgi:hypothetical protein
MLIRISDKLAHQAAARGETTTVKIGRCVLAPRAAFQSLSGLILPRRVLRWAVGHWGRCPPYWVSPKRLSITPADRLRLGMTWP